MKRKKKIGIISLSNSMNYGGILQAVALSRAIRNLGMEPRHITYQKMTGAWKSVSEYVKLRIYWYGSRGIYTKLRILGGMGKTLLSNVHYLSEKKKQRNFQNFINQNLPHTPYMKNEKTLQKKATGFDVYITGSDQVWNTSFSYGKFLEPYFLTFITSDVPKYSYAASVGGQKDDEYLKEIIKRTADFKGITVREKSLENNLYRLGCEQVQTAVDPTLLLTKEEWREYEVKPRMATQEKYILVYYLEKDPLQDPVIKKIAEETGYVVINIGNTYKKASYAFREDHTAGPGEFLYYVDHAEYVITNSFHMTVFSLLFQKKFIALARDGQESRIVDLLQTVSLENRYISNIEQHGVIYEEVAIDVSKICEQSISDSMMYLKSIRDNCL